MNSPARDAKPSGSPFYGDGTSGLGIVPRKESEIGLELKFGDCPEHGPYYTYLKSGKCPDHQNRQEKDERRKREARETPSGNAPFEDKKFRRHCPYHDIYFKPLSYKPGEPEYEDCPICAREAVDRFKNSRQRESGGNGDHGWLTPSDVDELTNLHGGRDW
jgi:hypothetical protein